MMVIHGLQHYNESLSQLLPLLWQSTLQTIGVRPSIEFVPKNTHSPKSISLLSYGPLIPTGFLACR